MTKAFHTNGDVHVAGKFKKKGIKVKYSEEDAYGNGNTIEWIMRPDMTIDLENYKLIDRILAIPKLLIFGTCTMRWKHDKVLSNRKRVSRKKVSK